jgi:excisionase family DNA binding protein
MFEEYLDVLDVETVCEMLRVGHNTVYRLLNTGKLKGMRFGRIWKISKQSVIDFVAENSRLHLTEL